MWTVVTKATARPVCEEEGCTLGIHFKKNKDCDKKERPCSIICRLKPVIHDFSKWTFLSFWIFETVDHISGQFRQMCPRNFEITLRLAPFILSAPDRASADQSFVIKGMKVHATENNLPASLPSLSFSHYLFQLVSCFPSFFLGVSMYFHPSSSHLSLSFSHHPHPALQLKLEITKQGGAESDEWCLFIFPLTSLSALFLLVWPWGLADPERACEEERASALNESCSITCLRLQTHLQAHRAHKYTHSFSYTSTSQLEGRGGASA